MISFRAFLAATLLLASANAASAVCTATVDKTVKICSPASGATVTSPVTFSAGARDTAHTVTAMIMYIDSVKKAQSSNASLNAILSLPAGKHAIVIRAWDSTGFFFFVFRKHHRSCFTHADPNSNTKSNAYAHTNRNSYANSHRNAHADSGTGHRRCQSHYFRATGKPQL